MAFWSGLQNPISVEGGVASINVAVGKLPRETQDLKPLRILAPSVEVDVRTEIETTLGREYLAQVDESTDGVVFLIRTAATLSLSVWSYTRLLHDLDVLAGRIRVMVQEIYDGEYPRSTLVRSNWAKGPGLDSAEESFHGYGPRAIVLRLVRYLLPAPSEGLAGIIVNIAAILSIVLGLSLVRMVIADAASKWSTLATLNEDSLGLLVAFGFSLFLVLVGLGVLARRRWAAVVTTLPLGIGLLRWVKAISSLLSGGDVDYGQLIGLPIIVVVAWSVWRIRDSFP